MRHTLLKLMRSIGRDLYRNLPELLITIALGLALGFALTRSPNKAWRANDRAKR
jgi:hypothetical protein